MTPDSFFQLVRETILNPAAAAHQVMAVTISRENLWLAVLLATVLSAIVGGVSQAIVPVEPMVVETVEGPVSLNLSPSSPMMQGVFVGASLVLMVFALYFTGLALGGHGTFPATLALMAWLQVVMVVLQVATLVVMLAVPVLGAFLVMVSFVVFLRGMCVFVKELHGFAGLGRAVLTVVLAFLGVAFGLAIILLIIGIGAGGADINV